MKILVVEGDPHNVVALSVAFQLQWEDATVIPAADGDAGLKAFLDHDPDVVLLDVALPDHGAFDLLKAIRLVSDVPVILLASHGDETDEVRGLELGADDYVVNPFGHLSLLAHVKAVLRRADLPPPVSAQPDFVAGDLAVHFQNREVTLAGQPVKLTPVEYKLLYHLVRNTGRLMPHRALLDRVWGDGYGVTTHHLKVFVSRLRAKIERPGGARFIETERGAGYRFVRPLSSSTRPTLVQETRLSAVATA